MRTVFTCAGIFCCTLSLISPRVSAGCNNIDSTLATNIAISADFSELKGSWIRPNDGAIRQFTGTVTNGDAEMKSYTQSSGTWGSVVTSHESRDTSQTLAGITISGQCHSLYQIKLTTGAASTKIMVLAEQKMDNMDWFKFDYATFFQFTGPDLSKTFKWAADALGTDYAWKSVNPTGESVSNQSGKVLLLFYEKVNDDNVTFPTPGPIQYVEDQLGNAIAPINRVELILTQGGASSTQNILLFADDDERTSKQGSYSYTFQPKLKIKTINATYTVKTPDPTLVNKGAPPPPPAY